MLFAVILAQDKGEHEVALQKAEATLNKLRGVSPTSSDLQNVGEMTASLYNLMGVSHYELGKYSKALAMHKKDLELSRQRSELHPFTTSSLQPHPCTFLITVIYHLASSCSCLIAPVYYQYITSHFTYLIVYPAHLKNIKLISVTVPL